MFKKGMTLFNGLYLKILSLSTLENKLKIKFNLYLSKFYHQKNKKYVIWGLKLQKVYVDFLCTVMEPFISGVRPRAHV